MYLLDYIHLKFPTKWVSHVMNDLVHIGTLFSGIPTNAPSKKKQRPQHAKMTQVKKKNTM